MLKVGIRGELAQLVTPQNTARAVGSGEMEVFATPALMALAEKTCWTSIASELEEGRSTVGTRIELEHISPTPVGMRVTCSSELIEIKGRTLVFRVVMRDMRGPVGGGLHERYIISKARFAEKAEAKLPAELVKKKK